MDDVSSSLTVVCNDGFVLQLLPAEHLKDLDDLVLVLSMVLLLDFIVDLVDDVEHSVG